MRRWFVFSMAILILLCSSALAKEKKRAWQTGKLVNFESADAGRVVVPVAGLIVAKDIKGWVYLVMTDSMEYQFGIRSSKPLNLTVNRNVKFAIEKDNVFLIDDEGKEVRLGVFKKTAREP